MTSNSKPAIPTLLQAVRFWIKLGFISFGGPTGQIAIMHQELVENQRWISESRFLHALNFCMLLPGPEAQQLATYLGWSLHKTWGGILAGSLFVLPSALLLWVFSWIYVAYGQIPWVAGAFAGLQPAILAIVLAALYRISHKILKSPVLWILAGLSFIGLFFLNLPFPLIILSAGLFGLIGGVRWPGLFPPVADPQNSSGPVLDATPTPSFQTHLLRFLLPILVLWWFPVLLAFLALGPHHPLVQQGFFFSKAALVTFGGAYAVLPYVAQQAVENYGWLEATQMMDGLGLAETTPGPLIMVLQFVGFMAGWNHPAPFSPLISATLSAAMTTWVTFLPCFLWIFLGAPYMESLRQSTRLTHALSSITAAIVGVILNLALWFGWHILFSQDSTFNTRNAVIAAISLLCLVHWKCNLLLVITGAALTGIIMSQMT